MKILSSARTAVREFCKKHAQAICLVAPSVHFATTMTAGTAGAGHPAVIGICATINLAIDYVALHLTR
jgi:hypothetical protein